jgi:putative acetyltransferase
MSQIDHSSMTIRAVRDSDGQALAKLIAACFHEYEGCFYDPAEFPELMAPASWYEPKGTKLMIVEHEDQLLGCTAATPLPSYDPVLEIHKVYLDPALRGSGAAQKLLDSALHAAGYSPQTRLVLWTDTRFTRAHRFYERLGFVRHPVTRYLADVSDTWEFRYERALSGTQP